MNGSVSDLVSLASSVLVREAARTAVAPSTVPTPSAAPIGHSRLGDKPEVADDSVPLLRSLARVAAGTTARANMLVHNDGDSAARVTLYCTDFISDLGREIPSSCVTVSPRAMVVAPRTGGQFEIAVAVPEQAAAGTYSALFQAMGSAGTRAVLSVEVF